MTPIQIGANLNLEIEQFDLKITFLHGDVQEEIYIWMTWSEARPHDCLKRKGWQKDRTQTLANNHGHIQWVSQELTVVIALCLVGW